METSWSAIHSRGTEKDLGLNDVVAYQRNLPSAAVDYFSDVFNLVKLSLVVPAMNAVSEHSASALGGVKAYLRTTPSQEKLDHCMILHEEITDKLNMADIGNQFISATNDRQNHFGKFDVNLYFLTPYIERYESIQVWYVFLEHVIKFLFLCWPQ